MKKPKKKYPVEKMYDFHECMNYIEKKYGIEYDNRTNRDGSLWLWLCDNRGDDLWPEGCTIGLEREPWEEMPDSLKNLCKIACDEFAEPGEDYAEFWCSW